MIAQILFRHLLWRFVVWQYRFLTFPRSLSRKHCEMIVLYLLLSHFSSILPHTLSPIIEESCKFQNHIVILKVENFLSLPSFNCKIFGLCVSKLEIKTAPLMCLLWRFTPEQTLLGTGDCNENSNKLLNCSSAIRHDCNGFRFEQGVIINLSTNFKGGYKDVYKTCLQRWQNIQLHH